MEKSYKKLEKITLECIQEVIEIIRSTKEKPFNPRNCIHMLIEQIMAILVRYLVSMFLLSIIT